MSLGRDLLLLLALAYTANATVSTYILNCNFQNSCFHYIWLLNYLVKSFILGKLEILARFLVFTKSASSSFHIFVFLFNVPSQFVKFSFYGSQHNHMSCGINLLIINYYNIWHSLLPAFLSSSCQI